VGVGICADDGNHDQSTMVVLYGGPGYGNEWSVGVFGEAIEG
jgi:hypothetical protein